MLSLLDGWLKMPIGDATFYAVFGFLFVSFGIIFLILIFTLLGLIMKKINNKQKKVRTEKKESVEAPKETDGELIAGEITPELVAVITAAICACMEEENARCDFVVRRIKRL